MDEDDALPVRRRWRARTFDEKRSPSPRATSSPRVAHVCSSHASSHRHAQDRFRTYEGPSPFQAKEGEERPGLTHFNSGSYITERSILARPNFEPGHINPGGSGRVLDRSGPKRTRP